MYIRSIRVSPIVRTIYGSVRPKIVCIRSPGVRQHAGVHWALGVDWGEGNEPRLVMPSPKRLRPMPSPVTLLRRRRLSRFPPCTKLLTAIMVFPFYNIVTIIIDLHHDSVAIDGASPLVRHSAPPCCAPANQDGSCQCNPPHCRFAPQKKSIPYLIIQRRFLGPASPEVSL